MQFFVKTILTGIYFLYITGVFEEGLTVTETSVRAGIPLAFGFIVYRAFSEVKERAEDKDNPNEKERALGKSLGKITPWVVVMIIASLTYFGVTNIYRHLLIISGLQFAGGILVYKQWYWTYKERNSSQAKSEAVEV